MATDLHFTAAKFMSLRGVSARLKTRKAKLNRQKDEVLIGHRRPVKSRKKKGISGSPNVVEQGEKKSEPVA